MISSRYYSASRLGTDQKPRTAMVVDEDDELYGGFNEVAPALDTKNLREDQAFQETLRTAGMGRKAPSRMGTGMIRLGTVSMRGPSSRAGTATRPVTAVRAAGYTSVARDTPSREEKREESIEDRIKQMEARIMSLVEESCMLSSRREIEDETTDKKDVDMGQALAKAQEASTLERQLIRVQEQANLGDTHNLDLTFAVLCNLAGQYALNEMYTEALNTYQLLTRNKLFPHANRLKVNMGNIYFKMGEHPKALKLYRMALDQTPTAEKDLRMKVMHNIGLLLVRMGKFRDAVTNFQHIMHEQGDFQTGLHLVLCSVALNDAESGKAAFHAMLDVDPPVDHHDIAIDDENDVQECVVRDVARGDALAAWSRREAARAQRCLLRAARALQRTDAGNSWCIEALRNYNGGGAGARLELSSALSALRRSSLADGHKALQRLKAATRAHHSERVLRAEAEVDSAFVAYSLGLYQEAKTLSEAAVRDDPYSCPARICSALSTAQLSGEAGWSEAVTTLTAATQLDPADVIATYNLALAVGKSGADAAGAWSGALLARARLAAGAGSSLRALAAAASRDTDPAVAEHWYSMVGGWDCGVTCALAQLHSEAGDVQAAKHHYQDVEAVWPCDISTLEWLGSEAQSDAALAYYRRAARVQPNHPKWGLMMGQCLRATGKYQEALTVYKKMNSRFPDNVQCLKLIVKLCGDQGLPETAAWTRELQRAQARLKQQDRAASVASTGSGSSGASHSPIDQVRGNSRVNSAAYPPHIAASRHSSEARVDSASHTYTYSADSGQETLQPINRSTTSTRSGSRKKPVQEFDDDLPLPPE